MSLLRRGTGRRNGHHREERVGKTATHMHGQTAMAHISSDLPHLPGNHARFDVGAEDEIPHRL